MWNDHKEHINQTLVKHSKLVTTVFNRESFVRCCWREWDWKYMSNLLIGKAIQHACWNFVRSRMDGKWNTVISCFVCSKNSYNSRSKYHTERTCASCYRFMNNKRFEYAHSRHNNIQCSEILMNRCEHLKKKTQLYGIKAHEIKLRIIKTKDMNTSEQMNMFI